ncbi:Hsp20 family protein [Asticcacaulis sp. 201]|uniref:Hsp20 family protein n=1 Tax=Asticcacaulis sp. 201 TaxID=3028787 RepID=UPI0029160600|nr:Hsp20 family protein [Asticcacaulis sp. 201]MDV6331371.1 Hsp20 family protein [Asticcacaulis sp. 201]
MTRTVVFDSPYLLGFDDMRSLIERIGRSHDNYPPYNVESLPPDHLRISIAVAGFTADQLRIEVKGAHLTVSATKDRVGETPEREYLHRGIALRGFTRAFVLSDGLDVRAASLAYGLLHIDLVRPTPVDDIRIIPIKVTG